MGRLEFWKNFNVTGHDIHTKSKDASQVINTSVVDLPRLVVVNPPALTVNVSAPSETVFGEVFEVTLGVRNTGTTMSSVQFHIQLGSDFLCAGRMRGSQLVQPQSVSCTRFRLVAVSPGIKTLPAVIVKTGEDEKVIVDESHAGNILVLPRGDA